MEVAGECIDGIREREREIPNLFPAKLPFFFFCFVCVYSAGWNGKVETRQPSHSLSFSGSSKKRKRKKKKTFERLFSIFLSFFFLRKCVSAGHACRPDIVSFRSATVRVQDLFAVNRVFLHT
jgi:hypothetical protein